MAIDNVLPQPSTDKSGEKSRNKPIKEVRSSVCTPRRPKQNPAKQGKQISKSFLVNRGFESFEILRTLHSTFHSYWSLYYIFRSRQVIVCKITEEIDRVEKLLSETYENAIIFHRAIF